MKKALIAATALIIAFGSTAVAQPQPPAPGQPGRFAPRPEGHPPSQHRPRWSAGDRLPNQYRHPQSYVDDWNRRGLRRPPKGYRWVRYEDNFFLVAIATGVILETVYRDERDQNWDRRYSRRYTYQDDLYYRECRERPDPAGVVVGALIGGLIGEAVGDGDHGDGAALAGVIIGGAMGAALTRDLDCDDRGYAYQSYYNGFNSGRPGSRHPWRNPHNGHRGDLRIDGYYRDPSGFRCTTFTQTIYIDGRPRTGTGRACRQPDGTWAIVN